MFFLHTSMMTAVRLSRLAICRAQHLHILHTDATHVIPIRYKHTLTPERHTPQNTTDTQRELSTVRAATSTCDWRKHSKHTPLRVDASSRAHSMPKWKYVPPVFADDVGCWVCWCVEYGCRSLLLPSSSSSSSFSSARRRLLFGGWGMGGFSKAPLERASSCHYSLCSLAVCCSSACDCLSRTSLSVRLAFCLLRAIDIERRCACWVR